MEVRALLDLMHENEAALQNVSGLCKSLLRNSSVDLKILDPEHGDEELIVRGSRAGQAFAASA